LQYCLISTKNLSNSLSNNRGLRSYFQSFWH